MTTSTSLVDCYQRQLSSFWVKPVFFLYNYTEIIVYYFVFKLYFWQSIPVSHHYGSLIVLGFKQKFSFFPSSSAGGWIATEVNSN